MALPQNLLNEFTTLVTHYPERRAGLIPALHRCQEELGGWLSPQTIEDLAEFFGLEPVEVFGVATFYPMFRLTPRGRHLVSVCHNISCTLRGGEELLAHVCEVTGAPVGGTSPDGQFTVVRVECQGACANAPMFDLDGIYHEDLDAQKAERILRSVK